MKRPGFAGARVFISWSGVSGNFHSRTAHFTISCPFVWRDKISLASEKNNMTKGRKPPGISVDQLLSKENFRNQENGFHGLKMS